MIRWFAAGLAAVVLVVGLTHNAWTAGGPDSYSYVTQADLWLRGSLVVDVPLATRAPWPDAVATLTPFGYRPIPGRPAITPMTGPGLPLMMAGSKALFGHRAMFLVVPLTGALLVWATFLLGTRVVAAPLALGAAWLMATSPTFLMMFKAQMSDVPAAAFWALAAYWTTGRSTLSAWLAGLAAGAAILIRPNLVPLAAVLFLWMVLIRGWRPAMAFAVATLPACLIIAAINTALYGSPLSSGYGELRDLFSLANVPITLRRYAGWFSQTQTPLAFAGLLLLAAAPSRWWPTPADRAAARLLAALAVVVWALYCIYFVFGAWWFLRFLLPSWPAFCIGTAAVVAPLCTRSTRLPRAAAIVVLLAVGIYGLTAARQRDVFPDDEGERRYATIAGLVARQTGSDAMILASMHTGPTRYYAGRATMRYDLLDPAWLDKAVQWLRQDGRHPYVLVEDWEMRDFIARFRAKNPGYGALAASPLLAYRAYNIGGTVYLFDLLHPDAPTFAPPPIRDPRPRCPLPAASPQL